MKNLFTCLLGWLLLASPALAQTTDPVRQKLDNIFAPLDKSQVPTGRLLEAAVPLAYLPGFDGVLRDSARTDMDGFRLLLATAQSARLAGSESLPTLADFNQLVKAAAPTTATGAIPIAIEYISYARLRPDAETAGLVRLQNQQLFDVAGRRQSPYQTALLFAAAPERTYAASTTVSLVLRRSLYLASGVSTSPESLFLDFGDGRGYQAATWDQPLSTTYAASGTKRVKVKLVHPLLSAQATRESQFDLTVLASAAATYRAATGSSTARYNPGSPDTPLNPADGFDWTIAPTVDDPAPTDFTHHRGALVNVRYGQGHTSVSKPFIVVEGYNTALIAPHLVGENNKNNDITSFLRSLDQAAPFGFNDALQSAGYDLIYLDFRDGADDIRRNALLFEVVVRQVNQWKQNAGSTEKNVVMGESMGGLVARYGLAQLVRGGEDPQTRLLLLHDSPQRGAYSPMGLQALARQTNFPIALTAGFFTGGPRVQTTSEYSDKIREGLVVLAAPATQQLALKNVTGITNEYANNTFIDGPYKDMVEFSGAPPATFPSIIATSDGSQCGRPQNTPAYQELTRDDRAYIFGLPYLLRKGFQSEAVANALPAYGQQNRIAHLRVWFTIRVLWLRLDIDLLNRNYTSPANTLPYETLPGGTTNLHDQQSLTSNYDYAFGGFWKIFDNTGLYNGDICFVPTYSALDVPTITPATAYAKYLNGATDNPTPPRSLTSFIAMENSNGTQFNQAHLRFTARNSEWLYDQMQNNLKHAEQVACSSECSIPATITGPAQLCPGATGTYSISNLPAGARVRWSVSTSGIVTPGSGTGNTFTVQALAGADGSTSI